jgi:serine/threonine protein kinase
METMRDTSFVGTERFMAPELFEGDQKYTSACDIYSLGMTFFEIATGDLPFSHYERNARVVMAVLDHERPEIPYDCPDVIINLIRYCWSQLAHERPSAREVLQYMDRYVVVQEQKRHFFEIDKAELLRNVPHSCVHSYDAPPTIPPHILGSHKLPETPEKITVVTLNRDDYSAHAMTTNSCK